MVWTNAASEHGVAVVQQVVGCDGGGDAVRCGLNKLHGLGGGDVLKHHPQSRQVTQQGLQHAAYKH